MELISQAVFLCGGLGTRLRPITDNIPKPMALINGKPFLYYLLKQLSDNGIKRFLLLTGYLGSQISHYFGDGKKWGWNILYSHGPENWDTARRIWEAKNLIDDKFLLAYSDNFVQIKLDLLYERWIKNNSILTVHLHEKSRGNVIISDANLNIYYGVDGEKNIKKYVELGYMLADKIKLFQEMSNIDGFPNICFSEVIKNISQKKKVSGVIIKDHYHSISDKKRLDLSKKYLTPKRILLIDRDGTINEKAEKGKYITSWNQFKFIDKNVEGLKELAAVGFVFILITNQAGISTNEIDIKTLNAIHKNMIDHLNSLNIKILKIYISKDHWKSNSFRRKPKPGMLFEAAKEYFIRLDHTFFIGDDKRDCLAARNAGCGSLFLTKCFKDEGITPDFYAEDIKSMVPFILKKFSEFENFN